MISGDCIIEFHSCIKMRVSRSRNENAKYEHTFFLFSQHLCKCHCEWCVCITFIVHEIFKEEIAGKQKSDTGRRKGNKLSLLAQHYLFLFCHVNLTLCKYIFMPIKEQLDPFYYNYTRYCMHVFKQHLSADSVIGFVKQFSEILISIGNLSISFDINSRKISPRS